MVKHEWNELDSEKMYAFEMTTAFIQILNVVSTCTVLILAQLIHIQNSKN